jgi:hypothetical protein
VKNVQQPTKPPHVFVQFLAHLRELNITMDFIPHQRQRSLTLYSWYSQAGDDHHRIDDKISEQHIDQDKSKPAYSYLVAAAEVEHPSDEGRSNCFIVETVLRFDRHLTSNLIDAGIQNTSEDTEAWYATTQQWRTAWPLAITARDRIKLTTNKPHICCQLALLP